PQPAAMERPLSLRPVPPYKPLAEGQDAERGDMEGLEPEGLPRSTVVSLAPPPPPPRDHLVWSLCTALYANFCCLGFLALVFSVKSRDRKVLGDYSGALSYGSTAKHLNITAWVLSIFLVALIIALVATSTISVMNLYYHELSHGPT
ncbi:IFM1 protein, partial [Corythaeola cristata]|nr:IFM1 protein [Corythaeola cristata]